MCRTMLVCCAHESTFLLVLAYQLPKKAILVLTNHTGPFPLPIVGNHFQFPKVQPWIDFKAWSEVKYKSPMITMWLGRTPYILLNDAWSASDLLDKRASIYSDRPSMMWARVIGSSDSMQTALPYGDQVCEACTRTQTAADLSLSGECIASLQGAEVHEFARQEIDKSSTMSSDRMSSANTRSFNCKKVES